MIRSLGLPHRFPRYPPRPTHTMRTLCCFAVVALAALGWIVVSPATATAAGPTLSGVIDLEFDRPLADSFTWVYEGYVGAITLNVPTLNITIDPSVIGPGSLNWSNSSNWNQFTLSTFGLLVTTEGNGSYVTHINNDAPNFDVLSGHGPTQTTASANIYFGFFGNTQVGATPPIVSNTAIVRFDATIPEGAHVVVDQPQVTLHNLTVNSTALLTGGNDMQIQGTLTNHGSGNFGGTVQGDFVNDALSANGDVANATLLTVGGQLQNTGELFVPGTVQFQSATGNDGTIYLNGGQFKVSAPFTNNGTFVLSAGSLLGPSTFTNGGSFQWTGGSIDAVAGAVANVINTGNSFTIVGAGQRYLNATLSNTGTITQATGSTVQIGNGALLANQSGALYDMTGDNVVSAGFQSGIITNSGTWRKSGGVGVSTISVPFVNMGTIAANSGTLVFNGSPLILGSASTLQFQISGPQPATQYGKIDVKGTLTAAGTLQVSLAGGFTPTVGNSFDILDWGSISGAFSMIELPTLTNGAAWNTAQLFSTGNITVVSSTLIPGDFNRDGHVDSSDFAAMLVALSDLNGYKAANGLTDAQLLTIGDINGSGTVTNADLDALRITLAAKAGSFTLVPEPSSLALALLAVPLLAASGRSRIGRRSVRSL
jgi:Dockerin type I domain